MRHGCYGTAMVIGTVLLLISLFLPAFGGGIVSMDGWQVVLFSPLLIASPGILLVYGNVAAVIAIVALYRVRIARGVMIGIAGAMPASWLMVHGASAHPVWATGVTLLVVACAYMYGWER